MFKKPDGRSAEMLDTEARGERALGYRECDCWSYLDIEYVVRGKDTYVRVRSS
jgi:hypothetical protein